MASLLPAIQQLPDAAQIEQRCIELIESGKYEENKALLAAQVRPDFVKALKPRTFQEVFSQPTSTLATLAKYRGEAVTQMFVFNEISKVAEFFSVGKGMTDEQREFAAELIVTEYYFLTVADLRLFVRQACTGKFGKVYDRLDGATIMDWISQYNEEREAAAAEQAEQEHARCKAEQNEAQLLKMPEWFRERMKEMAETKQRQLTMSFEEIMSDEKELQLWRQSFRELSDEKKAYYGNFKTYCRYQFEAATKHQTA